MTQPRIRTQGLVVGLVAAAGLGVAVPAVAPAAADGAQGCALTPEQLEASGARIRDIIIDNRNIFAVETPEEDNALFRLMNRLHVLTRPEVVRNQLLFAEGDAYRVQVMEETGRILRATSYLYEAQLELVHCDADVVDVAVRTRDVWTLKPGFSISRAGGENRLGLDLEDENFLGTGSSLRYTRRLDEERRSSEIGFTNRNLGGSWIAIDAAIADNSDGHMAAFALGRPFYSLDTRRAVGGQVLDEKREDQVYALGDEVGRYRHDIEYVNLYLGRSAGLVDGWARRWSAGAVYDRRAFADADGSLDPALIPADRKLVYPYLEYRLLEDRFLRAENLDQIQRVEDVRLGADVRIRLGLISSGLGADRSGVSFDARASWGQGDPTHQLWNFATWAVGRVEDTELRNAVFGGSARWYYRQSDRWLLYAAVHGDVGVELDLDNPIEIGGDAGLRGYPLRYQRGERRAQFTIEQRYFTDYYLWRLFRVGGAVFFDAGRVWGRDPYGSENLGLLRDVGFGLRLGSTRSSIGKMIHIDVAFPLDGDDSIDSVQFVVEGKRSF